MKIYLVSHYYDNGESYEDYRTYEDHFYYSTLKLATSIFWDKATGDYEGKYVLSSVELDTQETECLEKTPYLPCSSQWEDYFEQNNPEPEDEEYDDLPDPNKSAEEAFRHLDMVDREDCYRELDIEREWLSHEGSNYQEWEECEEEIKKRKSDILLDELNSMLTDLSHV